MFDRFPEHGSAYSANTSSRLPCPIALIGSRYCLMASLMDKLSCLFTMRLHALSSYCALRQMYQNLSKAPHEHYPSSSVCSNLTLGSCFIIHLNTPNLSTTAVPLAPPHKPLSEWSDYLLELEAYVLQTILIPIRVLVQVNLHMHIGKGYNLLPLISN